MKNNRSYGPLLLIIVALTGCCVDPAKEKAAGIKSEQANNTAIHTPSMIPDTISSKAVITDTIPAGQEEPLKPIQENFNRINAITTWTAVVKKDLWGSTEGGTATFYYLNDTLEKIVAREFGETYQLLTEYYLLKGQLSFTLERSYRYNRPIYYDSITMKENNDTEAFDLKKATITETRGYFKNSRLVRLRSNAATAPVALTEQKRLLTSFEKLLPLAVSQ